MNESTGHAEYLMARRDAVLATARLSPAARARIMGRPTYPGAINYTPPMPPMDIPEEMPRARARPVTRYGVRDILSAVAKTWKVPIRPLLGLTKARHFTRPRFAVVLLMKETMGLSNSRIAHCFNRESDASGHDMVKRSRELLATDPEWAARYHAAEALLKGAAQ